MIRAGVVGATGKLGKDILSTLWEQTDTSVGAVITRKGNPHVGMDTGMLLDNRVTGIVITDDIISSAEHCDVYIDCTQAEVFMNQSFDSYVIANKPIIIATTGFGEEQLDRINKLSESVPIVLCPNFSIGVYKFMKLVRLAAQELGGSSDIEIIEYHHKFKKDRPSGTASALKDTIRETGYEPPIPIHSVRAGNIIGEHRVLFVTEHNETIELSHQITSREGFSRGVMETIKWITAQKNGLYGIDDIFGSIG